VRVLLREGNWGLGAVRGKADGETFGLEVLSGLLGRLNGKSEDQLDKEAAAIRDVKLMRYQNDKYGRMGFVFGGYLIGEDIKDSIDRELSETESDKKQKKMKKRKRGELETNTDADNSNNTSVSQKHSDLSESVKPTESEQQAPESAEEKRRRKKEKRARKEERRLKKEQKQFMKSHVKDKSGSDSQNQDVSGNTNDRNEESIPSTATQSGASTPMFSGGRGRHVIRQRYIQQKKMACLDEKALNEVRNCIKGCDKVINLPSDIHDQIKRISYELSDIGDLYTRALDIL
jgi:Pin2-interacting protein X1